MKATDKTNVMRLLEQKKVAYRHYTYESEGAITGLEVAEKLGQNPAQVFKTLVTTGRSGAHYVFVIPVGAGLDLKKGAKAVGEKGWLGVLTGGLTATAGGIAAAVVCGFIAAMLFKPGEKR